MELDRLRADGELSQEEYQQERERLLNPRSLPPQPPPGRRALRRWWALGALAVAIVVVIASGGGGNGGKRRSAAPAPPPSSGRSTHTSTGAGPGSKPYAGLGARRSVFEANNPQAPPNPSGAPPGLAWYVVSSTDSRGRVIGYEMFETARPAMGDRERVALVAGIMLPDDATQTNLNSDTCAVWRSRTLRRLIGTPYARGTTTTGDTSAQMQAVTTPTC